MTRAALDTSISGNQVKRLHLVDLKPFATMAPAANETSLKVNAILQSPSDWLLWHQEFRGYIIRAQLDEYFDGKRELRTQPEYFSALKEIREFKEKEYSQAYLTEARRRNVAIPDGVTSHFEDVVSHEDHGPIYDLATKKANEEYEAIKDGLLIDGKNRYDALVRAYNREDKEVKFIHNWLNSSVAEHYRMAYFLPDHSYRQWYQDLKGIAIEPRTRTSQARQKLHKHYESIKRRQSVRPAELEKWIREWEVLFEQAKQHGVTDTTSANTWAEDALKLRIAMLRVG